jgi:hypothetical protein
MSVYIFTGPTLSADQASAELEAIYLPPASEGDVYRVACQKPQVIGIIDGYFESVPAVWHKEILWAMAQGIHVYGSASIGALRAAELNAFGMEGVGRIFQCYLDGTLEDDDEVAVAHSSMERSYQSISVAMVNIRATLEAAEEEGLIRHSTRIDLEQIAKGMFYQKRSYNALIQCAEDKNLSRYELESLRRWLPKGRVDQKRADALAMLRLIRARLKKGLEPKQVSYSFEYTANWEIARRRAGSLQLVKAENGDAIPLENLLDELRLEGEAYVHTHEAVLLRFLALGEAWRQGIVPSDAMIRNVAEHLRRESETAEQSNFENWLSQNDLSYRQFREFAADQVRVELIQQLAEIEAAALVPDHLRAIGEYARLAKRASDKHRTLESEGIRYPALADTGLTKDELLRWFFKERLSRSVPPDLARYCRVSGFRDEDSFLRAVLRERCYTTSKFRTSSLEF